MEEIWKDVVGYEGLYQVSDQGIVMSLNYNHTGEVRILKTGKNNKGYLQVTLCKNGDYKRVSIHRLVAEAFIENPNNLPQINHKDENKENNNASNLEWCDANYNINYGSRNEKVSEANRKTVYMIDLETGEILNVFKSTQEAERITRICQQNISDCCNGKRNKAGGYKWEYL